MLFSFTFNSESTRTVRKLLTLGVIVIVVLVIIDWLLGRLLPYITLEPPFILHLENVPGVEALWALSDAGTKPIVFTGSSQTYSGISPHIFNDRIKAISGHDVKSVDVTILGSVVTIERDLIRNLIIPNKPQVIFYGIEMRALRADSQDEKENVAVSDFRNESLGYALSQQSDAMRDFLIWLLKHSNLVRYRDNFHEWLTGARGINQGHYFQSPIDDLGYAPSKAAFVPDPVVIRTQFIPFDVALSVRKMLVDIAADCQQNGVQCILINMPIHQLAYQYISAEDETAYRGLLNDVGLPIWDFNTQSCNAIFGDHSFLDLNHLNSNGAEQFSEMIADIYAETFLSTPISGDASCAKLSS